MGEAEEQFLSFLTSATDGAEWTTEGYAALPSAPTK
jgi:hypothetical protein